MSPVKSVLLSNRIYSCENTVTRYQYRVTVTVNNIVNSIACMLKNMFHQISHTTESFNGMRSLPLIIDLQ